MRTCEYCGLNTDTRAENCPSCNAPLPPLPARPAPQSAPSPSASYSSAQVYDTRGKARVTAVITVLGLVIISVIILALVRRAENPPPSASTAPVSTGNTTASANVTDTPKRVSEELTNPALRQIIERYFGKEAGKLTRDDLATIKFLYLKGETAYLSDQPMGLPGTFEPELDAELMTAVSYDGSWQGGTSLDCLTGLKTLAFEGVSGAVELLPAMDGLERLAIYSGAGVADFTYLAKFPSLKELFVSGGALVSLDGISELTSLEKLGLFSTGLTDLGILSQMPKLSALTLSGNKEMQGIQTLESMTWLTELAIDRVEFYDLNFIGSLTQLERLTVSDTMVKSVAFLSKLSKLKFLRLTDNDEVRAIPELSVMTGLEEIYIDCSLSSDYSLDDASFLYGLSSVKKATLFGPNSLEPLKDFASLQYLYLKLGWRLEDISPLGSLASLEYLRMYGGTYYELRGVSALGNLTNLKELDLSAVNYSQNYYNYDFVFKLAGLEKLNISDTPIFCDFNGIGNLTNLQELILNDVTIHKSFRIYNDGGITSIDYSDELPLADFAGQLAKLTNLVWLELCENDLTTLSFATELKNLRVLLASDNYISDASPLAELTGLLYVDLSKNAVEDWHVLDTLIDTTIIK